MGKAKAAHHRGPHQRLARIVVARARANPATLCRRCLLRLDQHPPHRDGRAAYWTAGHDDRDLTLPMGPEASTCNYSAGASKGNRQRRLS